MQVHMRCPCFKFYDFLYQGPVQVIPPLRLSRMQLSYLNAPRPLFRRRHFQMHFHEWKYSYFDSSVIEIRSQWSNWQ